MLVLAEPPGIGTSPCGPRMNPAGTAAAAAVVIGLVTLLDGTSVLGGAESMPLGGAAGKVVDDSANALSVTDV